MSVYKALHGNNSHIKRCLKAEDRTVVWKPQKPASSSGEMLFTVFLVSETNFKLWTKWQKNAVLYLQWLHILRELTNPFSNRWIFGVCVFWHFSMLVKFCLGLMNRLLFCLDFLLVLCSDFFLQRLKIWKHHTFKIDGGIYFCFEREQIKST